MSTPSDRQEKGTWKMRCPRSPAKKRRIGPAPSQRGDEAELGHAHVLGLVDQNVVIGPSLASREVGRKPTVQLRLGEELFSLSEVRTRSKIAQSACRCFSGSLVFRPRRATSR